MRLPATSPTPGSVPDLIRRASTIADIHAIHAWLPSESLREAFWRLVARHTTLASREMLDLLWNAWREPGTGAGRATVTDLVLLNPALTPGPIVALLDTWAASDPTALHHMAWHHWVERLAHAGLVPWGGALMARVWNGLRDMPGGLAGADGIYRHYAWMASQVLGCPTLPETVLITIASAAKSTAVIEAVTLHPSATPAVWRTLVHTGHSGPQKAVLAHVDGARRDAEIRHWLLDGNIWNASAVWQTPSELSTATGEALAFLLETLYVARAPVDAPRMQAALNLAHVDAECVEWLCGSRHPAVRAWAATSVAAMLRPSECTTARRQRSR
jgi:hypothetical protein